MFKRIIIATDLSPASSAVAGCLAALKSYGTEECLLLQCLGLQEAASTALSYQTEPIGGMLREQKEVLERQGFKVEVRTVVGAPKREVNRIAQDENFSLIVVGTQGHSMVFGRILGGVAYGIINSASKPVLVVPVARRSEDEEACAPVVRCAFADQIAFATDFSDMADNAFAFVEDLVAGGARKVTLIHVQDAVKLEKHPEERLKEFDELDRRRLENLKEVLLKKGPAEIDTIVCHGMPAEEIRRLIQERHVQMLVMGTQGRGFGGALFLGSVSHNVARASVAPLLLIPGRN